MENTTTRSLLLFPTLTMLGVLAACTTEDVESDHDATLEQQLLCQAELGDPCGAADALGDWESAWASSEADEARVAEQRYWELLDQCESLEVEYWACALESDPFSATVQTEPLERREAAADPVGLGHGSQPSAAGLTCTCECTHFIWGDYETTYPCATQDDIIEAGADCDLNNSFFFVTGAWCSFHYEGTLL
jgi:hypothetical protein